MAFNRLKVDGTYETWTQTIDRVVRHQAWLWARARRHPDPEDVFEGLFDDVMTDVNCAFLEIETVLDAFWLLLQGCGVGFKPVPGCLHGFATYIPKLTIVPSTRKAAGGAKPNTEHYDPVTKRWTIQIGDSAEAWAKSIGKMLAGKYYGCRELVLDFSQIRPAGNVIKGYGWVCQGYIALADAYRKIFQIMNRYAGRMLPFSAIHDIMNLMGTVLSSRRSAQIALCDYGDEAWRQFAAFKHDYYQPEVNRPWREQSNNTLDFQNKPSRDQLGELFDLIVTSGGSEPGFRNAAAAKRRAPWARGTNPCGEILLPNRGFCNLCEVNLAHEHHRDFDNLMRTLWLMARANYRQTCVDLQDGILQRAWHENNENLRLCGLGLTGIVQCEGLTSDTLQVMRAQARHGAFSMADELGMTRPAAVTTIKPSCTLSKVMDCTEGMHRPLGKYVFNHIEFSQISPLPRKLAEAGYEVLDHPTKPQAVLVQFPVAWENVNFEKLPDGREASLESAVAQLERYRKLLIHWSDHNVSCTISYEPEEMAHIVDWFERHWDEYIGVSFLFRANPSTRAEELGYAYLPQEVVTKREYDAYVSKLHDVRLDTRDGDGSIAEECVTGACPVR